MSSDFKNIFIGADNNKRTSPNLSDNEKNHINTISLSSIIDASLLALRNTRELEPTTFSKISVNPNRSLSAQLNEYDRKKSALKYRENYGMKNFNITSGKVNQSLINAMRIYKIKPTLKMTLSGAMNNPNLKAFDELTEKEKYSITAPF
ncbi:hypothetical protein [Helicobacter acinonychis]|uniref:hypothetical protein n=3 Tax=Helicobacter acinonychis TaxID=212 RepID=UPI001E56ECBE|nr:hypothetical protein [Helicobacter acinonychis]